MLVVRPGTRFAEPRRFRPALSQPSGQRLSRARTSSRPKNSRGPFSKFPSRSFTRNPAASFIPSSTAKSPRTSNGWAPACIAQIRVPAPCTAVSFWCANSTTAPTARPSSFDWISIRTPKRWRAASRCDCDSRRQDGRPSQSVSWFTSTDGATHATSSEVQSALPRSAGNRSSAAFGRDLRRAHQSDFRFRYGRAACRWASLPHEGWLELSTADTVEWAG